MIFQLFRKKNNNKAIIEKQYGLLTAAARRPALYEDYAVPDTVMGRFEMLSAVLILYFRRTGNAQTSARQIAQEIVDAFFEDVDHSIRELGVGDLSVPKRMKKLAGMFYGRLESYSAALDASDSQVLAAALVRNIYPDAKEPAPDMSNLAAYLIMAEAGLKSVAEDMLAEGAADLLAPAPLS